MIVSNWLHYHETVVKWDNNINIFILQFCPSVPVHRRFAVVFYVVNRCASSCDIAAIEATHLGVASSGCIGCNHGLLFCYFNSKYL